MDAAPKSLLLEEAFDLEDQLGGDAEDSHRLICGWTRVRDHKSTMFLCEEARCRAKKGKTIMSGSRQSMIRVIEDERKENRPQLNIARRASTAQKFGKGKVLLQEPTAHEVKRITEKTEFLLSTIHSGEQRAVFKTEDGSGLASRLKKDNERTKRFSLLEQESNPLQRSRANFWLKTSKKSFFDSTLINSTKNSGGNPLSKHHLASTFLKRADIEDQPTLFSRSIIRKGFKMVKAGLPPPAAKPSSPACAGVTLSRTVYGGVALRKDIQIIFSDKIRKLKPPTEARGGTKKPPLGNSFLAQKRSSSQKHDNYKGEQGRWLNFKYIS